jgi:hypothetical protein
MENLCSCDEIRGFQVGREKNRPCVGGFHVRPRWKSPKHKREKPGGFHVRPRRNPPKSTTMGNPWFPCSYPSSSSSFSLVLPCVDVFFVDEFCVWATILRTCLALRWGAQLADVWMCLAFALRTCVGVPNLRMCLVLHWGAQTW